MKRSTNVGLRRSPDSGASDRTLDLSRNLHSWLNMQKMYKPAQLEADVAVWQRKWELRHQLQPAAMISSAKLRQTLKPSPWPALMCLPLIRKAHR